MLALQDFPFQYYDAQATEGGDKGSSSLCYAVWPALLGEDYVKVLISTKELSDYDGDKFGIDGKKVRDALLRHRDLIQARARERHVPGTATVTLDVGDLRQTRT